MPLGLAKDSMLNLAELASSKFEEETCTNGSHQITDVEVETDDEVENSVETSINSISIEERTNETDNNDKDAKEVVVVTISKTSNLDHKHLHNSPAEKSQVKQYAGISADYRDFENNAFHSSYSFDGESTISKSTTLTGEKNNDTPWWQCIFPWCPPGDNSGDEDMITDGLPTRGEEQKINGEGQSVKIDAGDDEVSMISAGSDNVLGEKLSQKDHQAVLARLRLAQPDATPAQPDAAPAQHDAKNPPLVKSNDKKEAREGILKRSNTRNHDSLKQSSRSNTSNGIQTNERRSLFPCYEEKPVVKKNINLKFSPMARVVTIKSLKDMDNEEKSSIWWQKPNYDEFRKTGRMISKVMLQGGSEIWLATNQSWQLPNQGKAATLRRAMANVDNEDTRDKWWHKFGHSRRGLEHIASIDEGRQRQANVKTSIRAILTEERRQKAFHREDPDKLRMVSIQNTSWAKDLALASGASDADAVTKNFDDESRRSREFYLHKFSRAKQITDHSISTSVTKQVVPAFMKRPNQLDANTTSRIEFRQKEGKVANHQRVSLDLSLERVTTRPSTRQSLQDATSDGHVKDSLARKAAGFANGEKAVNMSAVLTGMGPIPKSSDACARPVLA